MVARAGHDRIHAGWRGLSGAVMGLTGLAVLALAVARLLDGTAGYGSAFDSCDKAAEPFVLLAGVAAGTSGVSAAICLRRGARGWAAGAGVLALVFAGLLACMLVADLRTPCTPSRLTTMLVAQSVAAAGAGATLLGGAVAGGRRQAAGLVAGVALGLCWYPVLIASTSTG